MTEAPEVPLEMRRHGLDPVEELARARDDEGVVRMMTPFGLPAYLVCRYEDVREVLSDPTRFSNALIPFPTPGEVSEDEGAAMGAGQLIGFDPPEHTRLRRMLTPEFTVRRMRRLAPRITEIAESALDDLESAGKPADLVAHFALPVPSLVICELLGVPYATAPSSRTGPHACWTSRYHPRNRRRRDERTAPTWPAWSPAPRPTRVRTCWACWSANTATTCPPTN